MSAATTPAFAVGADHSYTQHHHSRSISPLNRKKADHRHDRGHAHHGHGGRPHSPSMRSLSPFGRHDSNRAKKQNVMVCHESAHAIVFRDHLRLARKIIQEVEEDDEEVEGGSSGAEAPKDPQI